MKVHLLNMSAGRHYPIIRAFIRPASVLLRAEGILNIQANPRKEIGTLEKIRSFVLPILSRCYSALTLDRQRYARASLPYRDMTEQRIAKNRISMK